MGDNDFGQYLTIGAFWFLVCAMIGCTPKPHSNDAPDPMSIAANCRLVSKTDAGQRRYCGKACFQTIYAYTYQCPGTVIVHGT